MRNSFIVAMLLIVFGLQASFASSVERMVTDFTKSNTKLVKGENLVSKTVFQENGSSVIEFKYSNCKKGNYYLEFWLCPAKHKDGTFEEYTIKVNGIAQNYKIKPTKSDWQSVKLPDGESVALNDGENTIQVISNERSVPNVDFIEVSPISNPINISDAAFQNYKANDILINDNLKLKAAKNVDNLNENPLYDFSYSKDYQFKYTFYKSLYLDEDDYIELNVEGVGGHEAILFFFKNNNPEKYSWSQYPDEDGVAFLDVTAPEAGYYTILLKSLAPTHVGYCNLSINEDEYFDNVLVSGLSFFLRPLVATEYNHFTVAYEGDPMMWIEELTPAETPSGYESKIVAFSDDGDEDGDFYWDINPRIRRRNVTKDSKVFVTSYSSNSPYGVCDLYLNCKKASEPVIDHFVNLCAEDAMTSSPATEKYNCISWSGGITSYWEWPGDPISQYYSENTLEAFDKFYASRGLTRINANAANANVALWAHVDSKGNRFYTHASIKASRTNEFLNGYDWESKPGPLERIFHTKFALEGKSGEGYGQIVEFYTKSSGQAYSGSSVPIVKEEQYNNSEEGVIQKVIASINSTTRGQFNTLYNNFKISVQSSPESNPDLLRDCPEYKELYSFVCQHPETKYMVFEKLGNNELPSILILSKLVNGDQNLKKVKESVSSALRLSKQQENVYIPIQTNLMMMVKEYLESNANEVEQGVSLIDTEIRLMVDATQIIIELSNGSEFPVNVELYDQYGNLVNLQNNIQPVADGKYVFKNAVNSKGLYILKITTPEGIYTQKVNI